MRSCKAMARNAGVSWKREGHSTVSPHLVSSDAQKVIDFMTDVLNGTVLFNVPHSDKAGVMHASIRIDDTTVMIMDADQEHAAVPVRMHVYVEDVDKTYELALQKGASPVQAPRDEFYGDRMSAVKDSAGNTWWLSTYKVAVKCGEA